MSCLLAFLVVGIGIPVFSQDRPPALDQAESLLLKGRYAEARELFSRMAQEAPERAAYGEARCWQALGNSTAALGVVAAALEPGSDSPPLRELMLELALTRGDVAGAEQQLKKLAEWNHESPRQSYLAAELAAATGDMEQAQGLYESAVRLAVADEGPLDLAAAEQLLSGGKAMARLAHWQGDSKKYRHLVQEYYPKLISRRPDFWPAQFEMAKLFAEKFNAPATQSAIDRALAINASAGEIYVLRASLAIDDFNLPAARRDAQRALATNGELIEAHALLADCALAEFDFEQAVGHLERARRLNPRSEAVLGRLAAAFRARDGANRGGEPSAWEAIEQQALRQNPHCGEFYLAMGDALDRMRKYPQAFEFYRRAEQVMPQRAHVEAQLGLLAMRLGQEGEARKLLERAFARDPFHVRVMNMLEVLEVLDQYAVLETEHFVLRFDRGQDQVLAEAAAEYLEEIYPQIVERLGYEPPQKSLFEIFSQARNSSAHPCSVPRWLANP